MEKKIQLRIMPDGTVESKTINIKGSSCAKYAEVISALTNSEIIDQRFTKEYYEEQTVENRRNEELEESYMSFEQIKIGGSDEE